GTTETEVGRFVSTGFQTPLSILTNTVQPYSGSNILLNGNVGIGITNSSYKLFVQGSNTGSGIVAISNSGSSPGDINGIDFIHNNGTYLQAFIRDEIITGFPTKLNFGTAAGSNNASTKMTLDGSGNLGIGDTNPQAKLSVNGNAMIGYAQGSPGSLTNGLAVSGNVGIGTTTPGAKLEVAGQVKITGGTPGANKVLTSDSVGLATWETIGSTAITPDSLDFTEFKDAMTLDASTDIALGALTLSTSGTGAVSFNNTGTFTVASTAWTATPTISGLITATSGLMANGALTANNTFTLGDNGETGSVNTSSWDVSTAGAASGFTGFSSSGNIDLSSLSAGGMVKAAVTTGRLSIASGGTDYEYPL
ncbi:MAG: hypothetical protein GW946_04305, partial [Candidatus Pacebacteria bacterium]|nr:hypothetical protein [Candidatus Paceibacterota bacterium]